MMLRLSKPMIDSAVRLLPQPLSPARHRVSPGSMEKEMFRTSGNEAPPADSEMERLSTWSSGTVI
ncbi:hypothetical protein D3C87_2054150 [compost metagenome]